MARTVIQIVFHPGDNTATNPPALVALANDGTMWLKTNFGKQVSHQPDNSEQPWSPITNIPQT